MMENRLTGILETTNRNSSFAKRVQLELKRASRYRTFISLIIIDLSALTALDSNAISVEDTITAIRSNMRETDEVSLLENDRIGLLTPETSRQGAEVAARRIAHLVKASTKPNQDGHVVNGVTLEIASFPDAGGNRTIAEFIEELAAGTAT